MHLSTMPTSEVWRRSPDASATTRPTRAVPSAALALGLLVVILADSSLLLSDPDSLWHVATGRWIWAHREAPTVDVFSHTVAGTPWIAKEWLSQLLLFAAHASAGWWGVVVITAASIGAAFVVLHEWLRARLRPTMALLLTVVAIFLGLPHFLARPHVLVLPIIALWMSAIVGAVDRGRAPPLAAALLMVVWTNMHGSFPLGLGLVALMAAEAIVFAPADARPAAWRGWASFLALAGVAALLSPYGWHAVVVPLTVGKVETIRFIDEWRRIEFDPFGVVAIGLLVTAVILLARATKREAFRLIAVGILGLMMIRHVRFISTFGLLVPFLLARVSAARWGCSRPAAKTDPSAVRLHPIVLATLAALLAVVVALVATMRPAPIARIVPDRAVAFAQAHDLTGPVYNTYDFGGFLIEKGIKTFVDGRTDQLFLGDFLPKLRASIEAHGNEAFAAILAAHHVTWALVAPRSAEARKLESLPGWSRLYADDVAAVYGRTPPP